MTFFGVILLLASVSAAAGLVPTRRAMRVSPSEVLKW
jgi:ABC-type lipoprotein release transport system permease subunit